jgi:hypothetical protein
MCPNFVYHQSWILSSPREAELQSPLPGNDANLLSLQETLLGCISEMPGNLIFLVTIFSIIGVGLDQDEYPNLWIAPSRQSSYIHAIQGLQELLSDRFVKQMDKKTNQLTRTYIGNIYDGSTN